MAGLWLEAAGLCVTRKPDWPASDLHRPLTSPQRDAAKAATQATEVATELCEAVGAVGWMEG